MLTVSPFAGMLAHRGLGSKCLVSGKSACRVEIFVVVLACPGRWGAGYGIAGMMVTLE